MAEAVAFGVADSKYGQTVAAAVVLGIGAYAMLRRDKGRRVVVWLAVIGFVGCFTELLAVA